MSWTNEGFVKRSDLRLRAAYPFIRTRIFEVAKHRYVIYFEEANLQAASIAEEFAQRIRFVTADVSLSNTIPAKFIREIEPIDDKHISNRYEGMPFTRFDLFNVISSKFPDFDLADVSDVQDGVNYVTAKSEPSPECRIAVQTFCDGLMSGNIKVRVDLDAKTQLPGTYNDVLKIVSHKLRPQAPSFVRDDESFWHENIDLIYSGHLKPHLSEEMKSAGPSCYIDFSIGDQASIRQALLIYDTLYLTPPLLEDGSGLSAQKIATADILQMCETGRVKFLLAQPEERCDMHLLQAAYERNPKSVIGRRASSAIVLGDLVQTSREYRFGAEDIRASIPEFCGYLSQSLGVPQEEAVEFLLWPQIALRKSLDFLMDRGVMGVAPLSPGVLFGKQIHRVSSRDLELEALMLGQQAHVAHAFNATYLPPRNQSEGFNWIANQIGDRLNFYRSFNDRVVAAWTGNERRREQRKGIMPSIPIFDFDASVSLAEISEAAKAGSLRREGRALVSRLSMLSDEDRQDEIRRLSYELRKVKAKRIGLFSFESLEDAGPLLEALGAHAAPPLFAAKNLLSRALNLGRRSKKIDNIVDTIQHDLNSTFKIDEDIDFLSKVDRVASLKRDSID